MTRDNIIDECNRRLDELENFLDEHLVDESGFEQGDLPMKTQILIDILALSTSFDNIEEHDLIKNK
jgi:hypothetical protein